MFHPNRPALFAAATSLALSFIASPLLAQEANEAKLGLTADLQSEIARLEQEISAAHEAEGSYSGGALGIIAALNTQTLELTQSILEARLAAEETGAPIEIALPAVEPDPELATDIEAQIEIQEGLVEKALAEAQATGGLMQALAMTRYETERLTLAQLRQAWLRAQYGIAFPIISAPEAPAEAAPPEAEVAQEVSGDMRDEARPEWADPDHPDIDYSTPIFTGLASDGFETSGWWAVQRSRAEIDDSPQVFAVNVSDWGGQYDMTNPSLKVGCIEGDTRVIFSADDYLLTDFNTYRMPVTVRIDEDDARSMSWSSLTSNDGAGLFSEGAEEMLRDLRGASKVFLRLEERNGEKHDLSINLAGSEEVFKEVAEACQFSLIKLSRDDYRAIQSLLNAGGFEAGTPDGIWGRGSQTALAAYQAANGLEETGAPNEATLAAMGVGPAD